MIHVAPELFWCQCLVLLGEGHGITSQFLLIFIEYRVHELNRSHFLHVVRPSLLKDFYACQNLPRV